MKIIDKKHICKNGGSCAECNDSYSGLGYDGKLAYRCLVEYDGITEPMNLCETCCKRLERERL